MKKIALLVAGAFAMLALPAFGQGQPYDLQTMNFDLWCQETQHWPAERCDKRTASDEATFEAYRAKVEKYEIPYLKSRENGQQLDRTILHNDPVDKPVSPGPLGCPAIAKLAVIAAEALSAPR